MEGKVKTVTSRGFGFITTADQIDWFFHYTQFHGNWRQLIQKFVNSVDNNESIYVTFDNDKTASDGPRAVNVKLKIDGDPKDDKELVEV